MKEVKSYIAAVKGGARVCCTWERLAVKRHLQDLKTKKDKYFFDKTEAERAITLFSYFRHWKGEWGGQPIRLEPWQKFLVAMIFGWRKVSDSTRRFRTVYLEIPRKNGKTTLAAGIGLLLHTFDGEAGAEVYTAATKLDQARLCHKDAVQMVKNSPELASRINVFKDNLLHTRSASKFVPLGADSKTLDGLNAHGVIADELHAWPTRDLWDVLETATGARRQALMLAITTAGFDRNSICFLMAEQTKKILDGLIENDSWFGCIFSIDDGDNWEDERNWGKANPNLGVSVKIDDFRKLALEAKQIPTKLNSFLRLKLNVWTTSETRWITPEKWALCGKRLNEDDYLGRTGSVGLDLSTSIDITAAVLVLEPESGGDYIVIPRFFIPEERMLDRVKKDHVPYDVWVREGWIIATPGDVIDYYYVQEEIRTLSKKFKIRSVAYDPWGAQKIKVDLENDGFELLEYRQGFKTISPATKDFEVAVLSKKINHGNNPVLNWMASNVVMETDAAGNIKPSKSKSTEKIDGIVATIMGFDFAIRNVATTDSVYNERGILSF